MLKYILTFVFLFNTSAYAATVEQDSIITHDFFSRCVNEEDLDAAFSLGKGAKIPRTCVEESQPFSCELMKEAYGHALSTEECGGWKYAYQRAHCFAAGGTQADCALFRPVEPLPPQHNTPSQVPLSGSFWFLFSVFVFLFVWSSHVYIRENK